nr:MAG TPA: hypothetical protein [Caudoviricetes sp.]
MSNFTTNIPLVTVSSHWMTLLDRRCLFLCDCASRPGRRCVRLRGRNAIFTCPSMDYILNGGV